MRIRNLMAVGTSLILVIALTVAVVMISGPSRPAAPRQQTGTAAGRPHRVSAAVSRGRVADGRIVDVASAQRASGTAARAGAPAGARSGGPSGGSAAGAASRAASTVPMALPPRPPHFPLRGKPVERVRVLAAPARQLKTGFDPKTSRKIAPRGASENVYANADGTRSVLDYSVPVNYRRPDGTWVPISTTLVPGGAATSPASPPASPSPSSAGTPGPATVPQSGWTEQSQAQPEVFAPYANAPDLVTVPLGGGRAVAFGVANALAVPGAAQGSTVTYAGALADSTIRFIAGTGMVTEQIVLTSPSAPASWVFPLDLKGLRAQAGPGGLVQFADASGTVRAYVPHGFMSDSNIDPHSGDGATSFGVTYSLITVNGRQAIKMTLDTAWLDSPARVFPVTVDPSVSPVNSDGTTYVQYPDNNDFSGDIEMHVGTWDGGSDKAKSFMAFTNVASSLKNDTVLGAELGVFNTWSYSCSPRAVYVYPVTSSWSATGDKTWPGPSTGAAIGRASFATGWVQLGKTTSPCPARWEPIKLNQAGTNLINGWTHGTVADNGLALGASDSDSYAWKKFASLASGTGDPFLAVTYTPDGATYSLASRKPLVEVLPGQNGKFAIKVTNTGSNTWTPTNGFELSYEAYNRAKQRVANHPVFTPMPSTVAPGQTVTVDAVVDALPAGKYAIDFDMYSGANGSSPVSFLSQDIGTLAVGLDIPQPPPTVSGVYPPPGYIAPTLRQALSVVASTATGTITYSFTLTCKPLPNQTCPVQTISSGSLTKAYWTPPATSLQWNTPYQWSVTTTVNGSSTTVNGLGLEFEVQQPVITDRLGTASSQAFDPLSGNYTTSATDAAVTTAGIPLQIDRTYNSMDPRTSEAFGAGWSSIVDTALRPDGDSTGNTNETTGDVLVTLPDGKQLRFGENADGGYAPPAGSLDTLKHNSGGTWTLRDSSDEQLTFTSAGLISKIADRNGRSLLFTDNSSNEATTITDSLSGRTLTLTWAPAGGSAKYAHVSSVSTQPPAAGQSGYTWNYAYTGDELTGVCSPGNSSADPCTAAGCPVSCTAYGYGTGSNYLATVFDSGARSYWQLGEGSGTDAVDEVDANLGTTDGTYSNVGLGVAGPLAGSAETAASFNGTSSLVSLPSNLITDSTDETIGLWFKGASSTASGVLFSYEAQPPSKATGNHTPVLYVGGNGELYGEFWNGSVNPIHTSTSVDDGKWHYVVLTAASTTQTMYLDGKQVGSALSGQIDNLNMTVDTIGAGYWSSWPQNTKGGTTTTVGYFNGDIAQVAVYPHTLGALAVTAQYTAAQAASPELNQVTMPSGNVSESTTYDPTMDRVATYIDPNGGTWVIGQSSTTGYRPTPDSLADVVEHVTVTDPGQHQDSYAYDMLNGGRLISSDNGVDPAKLYGYDANGFLASFVDQDGNVVCMTNDSHGNVLTRTWYGTEPAVLPGGIIGTVTGCGGSTSSSPTCTSVAAPCTTFYGYAPYSSTNPLDPTNGELTSVRDGRSASATDNTYLTKYAYNSAGQLTSSTTPPTSDYPSGRATTYTYSAGTEAAYPGPGTIPAGLLLSKTTPGGATTSYLYDPAGDLTKLTEPSGRYTVNTYDALGRVVTSTVYTSTLSSGETTSYAYDALNRKVTVTHPGVPNALANVTHTLQDTYSYDSDGDLLSLTQSDTTGNDPTRTTSYTYNDQDQIETVTQPAGATSGGGSQTQGASSANPQGATTGYDYDAFGNVTTKTDPNGNEYRYTYNEYNERVQTDLYTPSTSESTPTANCGAPAVQDSDGGCDLVLESDAYDPAGLLASTTDAMGRIVNNTYDFDQELLATTSTDGSTSPSTGRQTLYGYDGAGNLISKSLNAMSAGGVKATTTTDYTVDAANRLDSLVVDPGTGNANQTISYTYDKDDHVLSKTTGTSSQGGPSVADYTYDAAGDRTSQTVVDGGTNLETTWTYDQNGMPLSMTTPAGNVSGGTPANYTTNYTYDASENPVTVTGPPVQTENYFSQAPATSRPVTTYGYDTFGDKTQTEDPDGDITVTGYDGDGRVTSILRPSYTPPGGSSSISHPTAFGYDENGNVVQVTDPAGNVTQFGYDALGDVTSVTEPQLTGQSAPGLWQYTYDADQEQLSAKDPLGNTTSATYDYFGDQASSTDPLNDTTTYGYDYLGDLTSQTSPDGVVTTATYDHLGELTSVADSYGDTTSYSYDYAGRLSRTTNPDGSYTADGYDVAGNQTSEADYGTAPSGQTAPLLRSESFGYDPDGDLTSVKDWNGNTTSYAYNAAGRLTSKVQPVTSSTSITTVYGYDPAGNQTSVTDGNNNTTWTTYNTWNLPESVIKPATPAAPNPADRTWTAGYDAAGRPVAVSQPGGITQTYGYDQLGDLTSAAGSGGTAPTAAQTLGYSLDGQLTSASAPGGTDTYHYYANGELKDTSGPSGTSSFTYNNDGLLASETGPGGTTSYTYDQAGRLATLADPLTGSTLTYGYNANSKPTSIGYSTSSGQGPTQSFTYDSLNRLASDTLKSASGATLASQAYGYDNNGNLTSQTTTGLAGAGTTTYTYDQANWLQTAVSGGTTTDYSYDNAGNLTRAGATSYAYNAQDQLTSATTAGATTSYAYTLSGALASVTPSGGSAQNYTSDAFGDIATAPGGVSYGYDALGRVVTRTLGSGSTSLSYLGTGATIASDGGSSYSYTPSGTVVAAQASGGTGYATMSDLHGDLTALFGTAPSTASVAGSAAYNPYGTVSATSGAMPGIGYQGDYTDPATGLVHMGARWYNPATGSFITNDTLGGYPVPSAINSTSYGYAFGNPLTTTDPTGHGCSICSWIGAAFDDSPLGLACQITICGWINTPYSTASGCQDVICTSNTPSSPPSPSWGPPSCAGMEGVISGCGMAPPAPGVPPLPPSGPTTRPGCGTACAVGVGVAAICLIEPEVCAWAIAPIPPPPPPPPPQDCYAAGTCKVPPASKALRDAEHETSKVRDIKDPDRIPKNRTIDEEEPATKPLKTPGDGADNASKAADTQEGGGENTPNKPTSELGQPESPKAPDGKSEDENLPWQVRIAINAGLGGVGSVISDTLHGTTDPVKIIEDAAINTVTGSLGGVGTKPVFVLGGDALGAGLGSIGTQLTSGTFNLPKAAADATLGGLAGGAGYLTGVIKPFARLFGDKFGKAIVQNIGYGITDLFGSGCDPSNPLIGQAVC